jgi:hypothetical protein
MKTFILLYRFTEPTEGSHALTCQLSDEEESKIRQLIGHLETLADQEWGHTLPSIMLIEDANAKGSQWKFESVIRDIACNSRYEETDKPGEFYVDNPNAKPEQIQFIHEMLGRVRPRERKYERIEFSRCEGRLRMEVFFSGESEVWDTCFDVCSVLCDKNATVHLGEPVVVVEGYEGAEKAIGPFADQKAAEEWLRGIGAIQADHHQIPETVW